MRPLLLARRGDLSINPSESPVIQPLRWAPPGYPDYDGYTPITINNDGSNRSQNLNTGLDYVINIDDYNPSGDANLGGITITGGRNVVIIGGRIRIENLHSSPDQSTQTALKIRGGSGIYHIEGLDIGGRNCNDGIALQSITGAGAGTVLQIQNCRIRVQIPAGHTYAEGFHPDCIQHQVESAPGFPGLIRYDRNTLTTVVQGLFVKGPVADGVQIYRMNIHPLQDASQGKSAHFLFWQESASILISIPDDNVYVEENLSESNYAFGNEIYPQVSSGRGSGVDAPTITTDGTGTYATWPEGSGITGRVYKGNPPGGDYAADNGGVGGADIPGIDYVSPGYLWPSSYNAGPLGRSAKGNILPAQDTGALIIVWYSDQGLTDMHTSLTQRARDCYGVDGSNNPLRFFDGVGLHYGGAYNPTGDMSNSEEVWAHNQGAFPYVSWTPNRIGTNTNLMQEINQGLLDATFREAADAWGSLGFRMLLRMFWEFNGNWFPWSPVAYTGNPGCTTAEWVSAWKRMVDIFQEPVGGGYNGKRAGNVGFAWSPSEGQDRTIRDNCYPGDDYVDWVMPDGYCHAPMTNFGWDTPFHGNWAEFREIFDYTNMGNAAISTYSQYGASKPWGTGETGCKYDSKDAPVGHTVDPNRKANWYRNIAGLNGGSFAAKPNMPHLCGLEFFDALVFSEANDWRVDRDQPASRKTTVNGAGQTISTTPSTLVVATNGALGFPTAGRLDVQGFTAPVTYTGTTPSSFTGCTIASGSYTATNGGTVWTATPGLVDSISYEGFQDLVNDPTFKVGVLGGVT